MDRVTRRFFTFPPVDVKILNLENMIRKFFVMIVQI